MGHRPTVRSNAGPLLEVHFLEDGIPDLYGKTSEDRLFEKLREERKFPGLLELREQIATDAREAAEFLAGQS